jgi:hypothetical protein
VFHFGQGSGSTSGVPGDSYPGDYFSCVIGGGTPFGGAGPAVGVNSMFQVQPANPTRPAPTGQCNYRVAQTGHTAMQVALMDGSVRSLSPSITVKTWFASLTPQAAGNESPLGSDW